MAEATALLMTLLETAPHAPTACAGWTAHELVAHLAAGAAEMADLVEDALAGRPPRPTRAFDEREAPYRDLPDDVLRERLVAEALRLDAAVAGLAARGPDASIDFAGRPLTAAELTLHGRSEAALHRWDLAGSDEVGRALLSAPELTVHAVTVLNEMVDGSAEAPGARAAEAGVPALRARLGSPGRPDVVVMCDAAGARLALAEPDPTEPPLLVAEPDVRLLALWGRRTGPDDVAWSGDQDSRQALAALLWGPAAVQRPRVAHTSTKAS